MNPTCATCRFFNCAPFPATAQTYANCQRHAPAPMRQRFERWPQVAGNDWCGEHEARPGDAPA